MNIRANAIIFAAFIGILSGCNNDHATNTAHASLQYQQIAWRALNDQEKLSITTEWKNAYVEKAIYKNKKGYSVVFHTIDDALLGPLVIFIEKDSNQVLAKGFKG
jgi:hypothetical protein